MTLPNTVNIIEVGPRDGLQNEPQILPTAQKIEFIKRLASTGLKTIEATSFVSTDKIPQLADASEVIDGLELNSGINYPVLVANLNGMQRALKAGAKSIAVFTSASETFCQQNTNCSVTDSMHNITAVMQLAHEHKIPVRGYISCTLGCPYEGEISYNQTAILAAKLVDLGCYQISLGDTIGIGTPLKAKKLVATVAAQIPINKIAMHFHDAYGQALANIYAVLEQGITAFDSSIAGLGGCPYAKNAVGNVATENLVYMLHDMGISTGIDLDKLLAVRDWVQSILEVSVPALF